jgi:membrane associated rhomboid family serine protease
VIPLADDNPTRLTPVVTVGIIVVCVVEYLAQASLPREQTMELIYRHGAIPAVLTGQKELAPHLRSPWPAEATLISSMFLHGGFMHLAGNMLYLWIFGNNVEDALGHGRFVVFYGASGLVAVGAHIYSAPDSTLPMVGASGAISGVLGAYLLLYPRAQVTVLVPIGIILQLVRLPAVVVLLLWFLIQFLSNLASGGGETGGVAWMAHLGGFVAGMVLLLVLKPSQTPLFGDGKL